MRAEAGVTIARLDLTGSRRCHAEALRRIAADQAEQQRADAAIRRQYADVPPDPFIDRSNTRIAGAPARIGDTPAVRTRGDIQDADYPPSAIRAEAQGVTRVEVDIAEDGRVTGCTLASSSGSAVLDQATCSLIQRRWRYRPATRSGRPIASTQTVGIAWTLPVPDPPPAAKSRNDRPKARA